MPGIVVQKALVKAIFRLQGAGVIPMFLPSRRDSAAQIAAQDPLAVSPYLWRPGFSFCF